MLPGLINGLSSFTLPVTGGLNATYIQSGPTQVFGVAIANMSGSPVYFKMYDVSTTSFYTSGIPASPIINMGMAPKSNLTYNPIGLGQSGGIQFNNGLAIATTQNPALTDQSGIGTGDLIINISYR